MLGGLGGGNDAGGPALRLAGPAVPGGGGGDAHGDLPDLPLRAATGGSPRPGGEGEEQVGGLLEGLAGQGWHVVHDASLGRGNVDHILIGPGGVFTVETKSHPGPVRVGRLHGGVLNQAQAQRKAIEEIVGEHVEPLVVFSRAWVDRPGSRRKGVRVAPARMLLS